MTRTIGVVTVGPSDYGIYYPILATILKTPELALHLIVSGAHLSPEFGRTVEAIEADGIPIGSRVEMLLSSDTPEGIAKSVGLGVVGFAQAYAQIRPDLLVVLGDRFEMYAATAAALPFTIPVAHIHGGELSEGAIDDALRHSMTKLSHLHFASTEASARRILQLGEEPWRITISGAPSLDHLRTLRLWTRQELETRYALRLPSAALVVTYHPVTLEYEQTAWQVDELLAALESFDQPIIFTLPNADTNGRIIIRKLRAFVEQHPRSWLAEHLGTEAFFSLMACAAAMVGNSSSGIVEAPSLRLPVVNIGTRQQGRLRAGNVIDVGNRREEIRTGIRQALSPAFRERLKDLVNPYGTGQAAELIVKRLRTVPLDDRLIRKRFVDLSGSVDAVDEHPVAVDVS